MHDLWVEKFRPDTLEGYVFKDKMMETQVKDWLANPTGKRIPIPNLMFSGSPGTGKTTLAKILIKELGVERGDVLEINASKENGVETIRNKIVNFCSTWAIGDYKIILLDEMDRLSHDAQAILRNEMETYADSVRFIMTCNYPSKIMPALHSRVQAFHIDRLDLDSFMTRMIEILTMEDVEFDPDDIPAYVEAAYPDLRKCIQLLDQFTIGKKLHPLQSSDETALDYLEKFVELFMAKKYIDARKYICNMAKVEDYENIYRYFYQNLNLFSASEEGQCQAILTIASGLKGHAVAADPEINLAATIIELSQIDY